MKQQKEKELLALCASPKSTKDQVQRLTELIKDPEIDLNCVDTLGNNALMLLCRKNRSEDLHLCIQIILARPQLSINCTSIDINHRNHQGWNALLMLCRYHTDDNLIDIVRLLIDYGIDADVESNDSWNALLLLCYYYDNKNLVEVVKLLLENSNININFRTNYRTNALGLLCRYYSRENLAQVMRVLIQHGIDINCKNKDQRNALITLCRFRNSVNVFDCVRELVENGADVNSSDCNGWSALHFLCQNYSRDNLQGIVCYLIKNTNINIAWKTNSGLTALETLSKNWSGNFHSLLDKMLTSDVQLDAQSLGRIILNVAFLGCYHSVVKLILFHLFAVPVDIDCKTPFDHLEQVVRHSFSLCKSCPPITLRDVQYFRMNLLKFTKTVAIHPIDNGKKIFKNVITYDDRCTYRHDGRPRHILIPSFELWTRINSTWNSGNEKIQFKRIVSYLNKHSHPNYANHSTCFWCRVGQNTDEFLNQIMDQIKKINPLFETKPLIRYGSAAEKSDIFLPGEFDRAVVFKHFRQSATDPKQVVYAGTCPETDSPLQINETINSSSLLLHFTKLVDSAKDSVSSVHIFGPVVGYSETCVTIHFLYRGRYPPALKASVDVTIAVEMENSPKNQIFLPDWCGTPQSLSAFLVPYRRTEGSHWQTSYLTAERDLLLRANGCVTKVHKMLKFLLALQEAKQNGMKDIPRKICPSSYALKTCMIQYLIRCSPPPWHSKDVIKHAIGALKQYPMDSSELKSFFVPDVVVYEVSQKSKMIVSQVIEKLERIGQVTDDVISN